MAVALTLAALPGAAAASDPSGHRAADRWIGDRVPVTDSAAGGQETKAGHRYQIYLDEGYAFDREPARYAGETSMAALLFNHRFFTDETINRRVAVNNYPENHRIGQLAGYHERFQR